MWLAMVKADVWVLYIAYRMMPSELLMNAMRFSTTKK